MNSYENDIEYMDIIGEILSNEQFLKLKNYRHHNDSIYDHVVDVSFLSYKISKRLKLDYKSTARGALLHDFFLYDWRKREKVDSFFKKHAFTHAKEALGNSVRNFEINQKEKDIIVKHMFPTTIIPPRYGESWIVTSVDKYLAIKEYAIKFFVPVYR